MSRYEAEIFDMDGVIADTEPLHVEAELITCRDFGFDIDPKEWDGFKGRKAEDIFGHLLINYGDIGKNSVDELIKYKTETFCGLVEQRELVPIKGALEHIEASRRTMARVALATSSNSIIKSLIVARFNLEEIFDSVITGDDVENGKPHPEPYDISVKNIGVSPDRVLVVEDSESGTISGLRAGCHVVTLATSHSIDEIRSFSQQPHYIVDTHEMAQILISTR